jgi:histidinol-phosphatase
VNADLGLALELADAADRITLDRYQAANLHVEQKADLTPVSDADRAVEDELRARLARDLPADEVLGEEAGGGGEGRRTWILDPIDGTRQYVRGIPIYATLIALEEDGVVQVGVVSAPALRRRWWAARGHGAFANGIPVRVSDVESLEGSFFAYTSARSFARLGLAEPFAALTRRAWADRGFGDFWQHMLVAEGRVEVAVEAEVNIWDVAAVQVIVEEAGGRVTDLRGRRTIRGGNVMTSNGHVHAEVLAELAPAVESADARAEVAD